LRLDFRGMCFDFRKPTRRCIGPFSWVHLGSFGPPARKLFKVLVLPTLQIIFGRAPRKCPNTPANVGQRRGGCRPKLEMQSPKLQAQGRAGRGTGFRAETARRQHHPEGTVPPVAVQARIYPGQRPKRARSAAFWVAFCISNSGHPSPGGSQSWGWTGEEHNGAPLS
jgi:hypothetical protein